MATTDTKHYLRSIDAIFTTEIPPPSVDGLPPPRPRKAVAISFIRWAQDDYRRLMTRHMRRGYSKDQAKKFTLKQMQPILKFLFEDERQQVMEALELVNIANLDS